MKNIRTHLRNTFFVALLSVSFASQAQYSHLYYHCQRDTIIGDAETYYHSWWEFENSLFTQQIYRIVNCPLPTNKMLLYHFTPTPLQVVGLAFFPPLITPPGFSNDPYYYYDTTILREYLYLCEAGEDTTYELARVRWLPADTSRFIKFTHTESSNVDDKMDFLHYASIAQTSPFDTACCGGVPYTHITNVAEYYFDTPITVTDSFYVGCSNISYDPGHPSYSAGDLYPASRYITALMADVHPNCNGDSAEWATTFMYNYWYPTNMEDVCRIFWPAIIENHWSDYGVDPYSRSMLPDGTFYVQTPYIPLVFPIVMVDTTVPPRSYCPKVENLQISSNDPGCIDLSWDAFVNHRNGYDISYGRVNEPQNQWSTLFVSTNFAHICDLDTHFFYMFRIAPVCDSTQNGAQWITSPIIRPIGNDTLAVAEPSALARHTSLSPNPTSGSVHLHSDYVVTRLDLYDTQGRHLDNHAYPGLDIDLDLSLYAPGLYHLVITTSQGITTKQIIKK